MRPLSVKKSESVDGCEEAVETALEIAASLGTGLKPGVNENGQTGTELELQLQVELISLGTPFH
jgi:hypothetical protein